MASYNKVTLMGNLTRDPQTRNIPGGSQVTEFGLAVNRKYTKKDGSQGEDVCFVDCVAFGKLCDIIQKYAVKGKLILVEGRLVLEQWEAQDGTKRSKHKVNINELQLLGDKHQASQQANQPEPEYDGTGTIPF